MIQLLFPKIPAEVRRRMEKWTAFILVTSALIWNNRYFNGRLNDFEKKYFECMESRVNDVKELNTKSAYNEKEIKNHSTNTIFFQKIAQHSNSSGSDGRSNTDGAGIFAVSSSNDRRLRDSSGSRRRRGFSIDEG